MSSTKGFLGLTMFDENDLRKTENSIVKELTRSSFTTKSNGKLVNFSALFQLAKLRLVALTMSKEFQVLLPSDQTWRMKNYFKLLTKQKEKTLILHM